MLHHVEDFKSCLKLFQGEIQNEPLVVDIAAHIVQDEAYHSLSDGLASSRIQVLKNKVWFDELAESF